ncbi:MAG: ABC transporter substrate-binding protein, partial [Betaproteobacteria bacterium]|nr:ABC transporter substrate-binding protein [Betaproteobacteria bacterium]
MSITDALGTEHAPAEGPVRIASLVPSLTETLFALGLGDQVVARTGFCIHPRDGVRGVPKVGGTKTVNLARLRALAPTHCLVNVDENELHMVDALRAFVPHVVVTHPAAPQDNLSLFALLGALFDRDAAAVVLTARWQAAQDALLRTPHTPCRVLYLIWKDPWMTVARGTYISQMLALIGAHTWPTIEAPASGAARYPQVDWAPAA